VWSWGPARAPDPVSELFCMAGAGALAGAIYWALAGRKLRPLATTA
jgi:hypothetical protein